MPPQIKPFPEIEKKLKHTVASSSHKATKQKIKYNFDHSTKKWVSKPT